MIFVISVKSFGEIIIRTINSSFYRKEMIEYGRTGFNSYPRNCDSWKKIQMYGSIENPLFLAKDVANWIEYSASNVSKMLKSVDNDEKTTYKFNTSGSNYQTEA